MLPDRRVAYGILFLAGLRHGELAGLRWRDLDPKATPLQRLSICRSYDKPTKTDTPRQVPVHPVLAKMLADWRVSGWAEQMGKPPGPDDLVVPTRRGTMRAAADTWNGLQRDLVKIDLRRRRTHDTRRTFATLCQIDGARPDILKRISHGEPGDIIGLYTTLPWPTYCEVISGLRIRRLEGEVRAMPQVATAAGGEEIQEKTGHSSDQPSDSPELRLVQNLLQTRGINKGIDGKYPERKRKKSEKMVTPRGFEPLLPG